jgi:hypothetical protein
MRSAVIKVVPSMPKPVEKDEPKVSEAANLGAYSIKSLSPAGPLLVGRQSKVSVELQYDSAKSGTEVYVALTPTQGGVLLIGAGQTVANGYGPEVGPFRHSAIWPKSMIFRRNVPAMRSYT